MVTNGDDVKNVKFAKAVIAAGSQAVKLPLIPDDPRIVDSTGALELAAVPQPLYRERYPALLSLDRWYGPPGGPAITGTAFQGVPAGDNVIARNVCFGKWLDVAWHAKPEDLQVRDNYVVAESKPAPAGPPGFRLPPDSPAFKLGFQAIPFDQVGLRPDADRQRLANTR